MALVNRKSVLAVIEETTEGTPVEPSASTDYVALQDDFAIQPSFDTLENAELKDSIGRSKVILGMENPTGTLSHYLRHSGTEGQAPNYSKLLEAVFGTETVQSSERDTVSSSTVSAIKVDTGEGSEWTRGTAVLVKDGTNGYSIRPIHSISTDDLVPAFDLDNAPASGVTLGKYVSYSPADTDHITLSLWHYLANGGGIQMMSGGRVTSFNINFPAGQLINADFSIEGLKYYFNPITIASSDTYLDFTDDNGTFAAQVTAKTYKDPHDLAAAIESAMNSVQTDETHTCTYSDSTGKFTIATDTSAVLSLLWDSGSNSANTIGDKIGFTIGADDTGATTYTSDDAQTYGSPDTPSYDDSDPLAAKNNEVFIGDSDDNVCFEASEVSFSMPLDKTDVNSVCAESGKSSSLIAGRTVEITVSALLDKYDVDKFRRFRDNTETRFAYNFGTKSGGDWVAGKCGCVYVPTATISSFEITNEDGLIALNATLSAYVDSNGNGEVYLNFL